MPRCSALLTFLALCGCASSTQHAVDLAQRAGLVSATVQGTRFRHHIFTSRPLPADRLYVFIEGDGSPWTRQGSVVASDPTPRRALALELAIATPRSVLYLGRPCYFLGRGDPGCTPDVWTYGRYSANVVASMATVVNRYAAQHGTPQVILVGYSGGGALAMLMAPSVPATGVVVTIAANLDIVAWSDWHGYLPLADSLNPATQPPLANGVRQWHLIGGRDTNVPERLNRGFLDTQHAAQIWRYPEFDHSHGWVEQWPTILARLDAADGN